MSFLQNQAVADVNPEQHQEAQDIPTIDTSKIEEVKSRAEQIKNNIESLGLEISNEQLEELTRKANDKAN